jgi:hypothetical protein
MNLDFLWRQPLQSPQTNKAVTQTSFKIVRQVISTAIDYRVLNDNALSIFENDCGVFEHSDMSTLTSVFRYDFKNLISETKYKRAPRLTNLLRFCEDEAKDLGLSLEIRGRLYQRSQRLREINQTIEDLIIFRNYSAHHTHERNDLGLCFKVSSTLLRFVELLELPSSWSTEISIIRNSAISILKQLYIHDPTNEFRNQIETPEATALEITMSDVMDKLSEMEISIQHLAKLPVSSTHTPTQLVIVQDTENHVVSADEIDIEYEKLPEIMTLAQLRQQLLEIRKRISSEFNLSDDTSNILSSIVIDEIILIGVQSLSEWKKLPSTSHIQTMQKELCELQLNKFWIEIEKPLNKFNWAEEN